MYSVIVNLPPIKGFTYLLLFTLVEICMFLCTCVNMYIRTYARVSARCTYMCMYVQYICMYVHICKCHMYMCMYVQYIICTYIHITDFPRVCIVRLHVELGRGFVSLA